MANLNEKFNNLSEKVKKLIIVSILLAIVAICGTVVTITTGNTTFFSSAMTVVGILGFSIILASE